MSGQFRQVAYKLPWGKIRGLSIGNPNSKNVYVCLHGWQDNCGLFKPLLSKLPQENHYIALDLVGHGLSDRLPDGSMYQFNIYPLALSHIVESLDVSKVNLIGHSLGGGVSGMYTALFPEKVERLILLDSAGMPLIRDDFKGHTKKAFLENVNYREKEEYQNTKEELFRRLDIGMERLGSGLSDTAKELWLERAARKLENGKFQLNRDRRLGGVQI
ncbi:Oidioi.mRNA.OKI2018_I69.chr1.g2094.t1.cds [Oikopleura dioica]|uniref:Oidioi.mRNA.OKI2018_I69.chr1.g2094.t1.cds n=1 Tax=Oikopleura dioica TaxID=34765 RepID=A0ABN7SRQ6_OIKDI|nr:Oidioi.mRNA.OKI2018_I69.chr1.g2094.t1.cds [Oikopleura dioica]